MMLDDKERELFEVLQAHSVRVRSLRDYCENEEQTKITLINPYLEHLGFDVRDPRHVKLEFRSDIGKGAERVDYAILDDNEPVLLIEAKPANSNLTDEASVQIRRYALALPTVKYIATTNGIDWNWYSKSDLSSNTDLNARPFLSHDASDPSNREIKWLSSLKHNRSKLDEIAFEENLQSRIFDWFIRQLTNPDVEFLNFIRTKGINETSRSVKVVDAVKRIWPNILETYIQQEIEMKLRRARMSDEKIEPSPKVHADYSHASYEAEIDDQIDSEIFQTLEGPITLKIRSTKRAWRLRGDENWNVASTMAAVCIDILRYLATVHQGGEEDFFGRAARTSSTGKYFKLISEVTPEDSGSWASLTDRWAFDTHASNKSKISRIREAAKLCTKNGKSVNLDDEIEIWNPTVTKS